MGPIRARVKNGKLIVEEPTLLPEGMVLDLVIDDEGDDLSDEERAALHAAIDRAWQSADQGRLIPADRVIRELRDR
jgi:hypothetical protein